MLHWTIFIHHIVGQFINAVELAVELVEELGDDEERTRDKPPKNLKCSNSLVSAGVSRIGWASR